MKSRFFIVICLFAAGSAFAAPLTVTSPNGGENWPLLSVKNITWTSDAGGNIKIILFKGGSRLGDIAGVPASQHSYSWTVGSYEGGTAPQGTDYKIKIRTLDNTQSDLSDQVFTIGSAGPEPGPAPAFGLTAPNGGESWPRGNTRLITWNPGNATGSVRLDLYKGGTAPTNLIGTITSATSAAPGQYAWVVGDRQGMTRAAEGNDYYIVIHAYTPDMKDAGNGPFTIASQQHLASAKVRTSAALPIQAFAFTFPRRGDHLYKGTGYSITWTTGGTASPVRLDLLDVKGTTVVLPIAENIANSGTFFWAVPMSLPDAETLYKMRLRTMDATRTDIVGPFPIAKAKPVSGPPAVKVTAPGGPSQLGAGFTYAIRWTSTCGRSANGPTDDFFTIELLRAADSTRARWLIENARAVYDGGNPDGSHSWHWDWNIPANETAGSYRVRVTSVSGQCAGLGEAFPLVRQQTLATYTIKPSVRNCVNLGDWQWWGDDPMEAHTADLAFWGLKGGPADLARVGFRYFLNTVKNDPLDIYPSNYIHQIRLWSYLAVRPDWYKDKGQGVVSAKLIIKRKWKMPLPTGYERVAEATQPCLGNIVLLDKVPQCPGNPSPYTLTPLDVSGPRKPVPAASGDVWEVDVSDFYRVKALQGEPDLGWALLPYYLSDPGPGKDCRCQYIYQNVEGYEVVLEVRMAKDID